MGLFVNRDFALLWVARTISTLGDWIFITSVTIWIATGLARGQDWAPLAVGGASIAIAVPTILVAPLAGVFVDRWDKRRTMIVADLLRFVLMLLMVTVALAAAAWQALLVLGVLYAVLALETICASLFNPAELALVGGVVPPERQAHAASVTQFGVYLGLILGPPIAAPLYFVAGIQWAFAFNAASFMVSFLAVRAIRRRVPGGTEPSQGRRSLLRELAAGFRFIAREPTLRTLVVAVVIVTAGTGALNALNIFFLEGRLHASPELYGVLTGAAALGALVGAPLSALITRRLDVAHLFSLSLLLMGALVLLYSRLGAFVPALFVFFLIGLPQVALNVAVTPLLLAVTPPGFVGRVAATLGPAASVAQIAGVAAAGYLASTVLRGLHADVLGIDVGPVDAIFTLASLLILAAGAVAQLGFRSVRSLPVTQPD